MVRVGHLAACLIARLCYFAKVYSGFKDAEFESASSLHYSSQVEG